MRVLACGDEHCTLGGTGKVGTKIREAALRRGQRCYIAVGISYADYAIALINELEQPRHIRQRFTIGY